MTDLTISENDLQTYNEAMESLEHHGILGQKWGRKQGPPYPLDSEDHSAAEKKAGWRKSLEGATEKIKAATEKAKAEIAARKEAPKPQIEKPAQNAAKKEETAEEKAAREKAEKRQIIDSADANTIAANASKLTTQELQEAVNRMNLMQQVNRNTTTPPTVQDKINGAINKLDQAATTVTKGIDAYNKVARIYNKFQDPPLPVLDGTAADRAKKMADDKKAEVEKKRKDLVDKAVKSGDINKILQVQGVATNEELGGAVKRINSINALEKMLHPEENKSNSNSNNNTQNQPKQQQSKQEKKQDSKPKEEAKPKQESKAEETPKQTETKKSEPSYVERLGDLANKSVNGNNGWTTPEEREERTREANRLYDEGVEKLRKEAYSRRLSDMATEKAWDDLLERASRNK